VRRSGRLTTRARVIEDVDENVADRPIGVGPVTGPRSGDHPCPIPRPVRPELGDRRRLVGGDLGHADAGERPPGGPLDGAEAAELVGPGRADRHGTRVRLISP
jgi:hypothetical protein